MEDEDHLYVLSLTQQSHRRVTVSEVLYGLEKQHNTNSRRLNPRNVFSQAHFVTVAFPQVLETIEILWIARLVPNIIYVSIRRLIQFIIFHKLSNGLHDL